MGTHGTGAAQSFCRHTSQPRTARRDSLWCTLRTAFAMSGRTSAQHIHPGRSAWCSLHTRDLMSSGHCPSGQAGAAQTGCCRRPRAFCRWTAPLGPGTCLSGSGCIAFPRTLTGYGFRTFRGCTHQPQTAGTALECVLDHFGVVRPGMTGIWRLQSGCMPGRHVGPGHTCGIFGTPDVSGRFRCGSRRSEIQLGSGSTCPGTPRTALRLPWTRRRTRVPPGGPGSTGGRLD